MPKAFEDLISSIQSLPGIGPKAAMRVALHLLENRNFASLLSRQMSLNLESVDKCQLCGNISEKNQFCEVCRDPNRDRSKVAFISNIADLIAIEKSNAYKGIYFVFGSNIGFFDSEEKMQIELDKFKKFFDHFNSLKPISEFILAFPYDIDSEVLCNLLTEQFNGIYPEVGISRIALGMPSGAYFEFTDKLTIMKSFKGRTKLN